MNIKKGDKVIVISGADKGKQGTVQRVYRENDNDKIDILFDKNGKKTLLLTYAKLEKI